MIARRTCVGMVASCAIAAALAANSVMSPSAMLPVEVELHAAIV
jgi:hypothetical protein